MKRTEYQSREPLPPEIRRKVLEGGEVRYVLPRRDLGKLRWYAIIPFAYVGIAIPFVCFLLSRFAATFQQLIGPGGKLIWLLMIPALFGISIPLRIVMALLYGHAEIDLCEGIVFCREHYWPFCRKRSFHVDDLLRLVITDVGTTTANGKSFRVRSLQLFANLKAELADGDRESLASFYPRAWLQAFAHQFSAELRESESWYTSSKARTIPVENQYAAPLDGIDRLEQPVGSKIKCEVLSDGFTLNIPPRGVWRGSGGLIYFALVWCGFLTLFTSFMMLMFINGQVNRNFDQLMVTAIVCTFWLFGVWLILKAVDLGRRSANLVVSEEKLMAMQVGLFGTTWRNWCLEELETASDAPSGKGLCLEIIPKKGKPFHMLTGQDDQELEWMATLLRRAIRSQNVTDLEASSIATEPV